jgi:hypothetical protein
MLVSIGYFDGHVRIRTDAGLPEYFVCDVLFVEVLDQDRKGLALIRV